MNFPSVSSMIGQHIVLLFGMLTMIGWAFTVMWSIRQRKVPDSTRRLVHALVGAFAALSLCCGCLSGIPSILTDLSFKQMNPNEVTNLEVTPVRGEGARPDSSKKVTIQDRDSVARGLESLEDNHPYWMNHEEFIEGYLVTAKTPEKVCSFYVFTKSHRASNDMDVTVVKLVPYSSRGIQVYGSTYSCPDFVEWLQKQMGARR